MKIINSSEFDALVLKSDKKVLVDFFANWCGPCKMLSPILEEVSKEYEGKVDFYKVDIDSNIDIAKKYGIMSIPALYVFENGNVAKKSIGLINDSQIKSLIE